MVCYDRGRPRFTPSEVYEEEKPHARGPATQNATYQALNSESGSRYMKMKTRGLLLKTYISS